MLGTERDATSSPCSTRGTRLRRHLAIPVLVISLALTPLLPGSASGAVTKSSAGKTATFALPPGFDPSYILPIEPAAADSVQQFSFFQFLLYRPLYWEGNGNSPTIDKARSLAAMPVYTNNGRTVTVHLKHYLWSNGKPLTSRDLAFFMNLLKANKKQWGSYIAGEFPDNVTSYSTPNPETFVMHLDRSCNQDWFTRDQLSLIQPMPQAAWDKTSDSSPVGNYDETRAGAKKVYAFLNKQAEALTTYATNPLWKVVDGPWEIAHFSSSGAVTFVRNRRFSGQASGNVGRLVELPFTSSPAEQYELRRGGIDYGYVEAEDSSVQASVERSGYSVVPWEPYEYSFILPNFNTDNAVTRNELRQLYIRQALQHLIDEKVIIKDFFHGFALPSYGPVPVNSPYADRADKTGVYAFNIPTAHKLLQSHGWSVSSKGSRCVRPGRRADECGAGIPAGAKLSFHLAYYAGTAAVQPQDQLIATDAAKVGISITSTPLDSLVSNMVKCEPGTPACKWVLGESGGWSPAAYPVDPGLFGISSSLDAMSYNSATNVRNMKAAMYVNSPNGERAYQNFLARELPLLWVPTPDFQVSAISKKLTHIGGQEPTLGITPENWDLG